MEEKPVPAGSRLCLITESLADWIQGWLLSLWSYAEYLEDLNRNFWGPGHRISKKNFLHL